MKIALLSDTHLAPRARAFNANLDAGLSWIRTVQPALVVHLGDITADGMYDAAELEFAASLLSGLEPPLHVVPGNHDIGDNPSAPGARNGHPFDAGRLADYRRVFGPDWWALRCGRWRLIGLNALLFGTGHADEARQLGWLEALLPEVDGPVGLMLHKPLFRNGPADREVHDRYVPWVARERLIRILHGHDLRFVVSGHTHQARRLQCGPVEHIWVPSTSFCIPDSLQEPVGQKVVGVGLLELDAQDYSFELVLPPEMVRHNLLDHADVYPEVAELTVRLAGAAALL